MTLSRSRIVAYASIPVLSFLAGTQVWSPDNGSRATDASAIWQPIALESAAYREGFRTVAAIARSVDLVVSGKIVTIERSRSIDVQGDVVHFARYTVDVSDIVAGRRFDEGPGESIQIEFLLPGSVDDASIESIQAGLPSGESLFFLRSKGRIGEGRRALENFDYYYVPTADSILTRGADGKIIAPYAGPDEFALQADARRRARSYEELVEYSRVQGRSPDSPQQRDALDRRREDLKREYS